MGSAGQLCGRWPGLSSRIQSEVIEGLKSQILFGFGRSCRAVDVGPDAPLGGHYKKALGDPGAGGVGWCSCPPGA